MVLSATQRRDQRNRVFASVFPVASQVHTTPTPAATPELGSTRAGWSFGSTPNASKTAEADLPSRILKREAAWSTATSFLSFSHNTVTTKSAQTIEALRQILLHDDKLNGEAGEHNLVDWYIVEVRRVFYAEHSASLLEPWHGLVKCKAIPTLLQQTLAVLQRLENEYMLPLVDTVIPILCENIPVTEQKKNLEHRLRRSITEILISVLPRDKFLKAVRFFLYHAIISFLRFSGGGWDKRTQQRTSKGARIQSQMRNMCMGYSHVGIRPEVIQRTLADAVDMVLNELITNDYMAADRSNEGPVSDILRSWIQAQLNPLIESLVEGLLKRDTFAKGVDQAQLGLSQAKGIRDVALWRLGTARLQHLFDYVQEWDDSKGAILDLKDFIQTVQNKAFLSQTFIQQLSRRLLEPATQTSEILDYYVRLIKVFMELDPGGVLLDRVSRPIRAYLRERKDTARIVVASSLTAVNTKTGLCDSGESGISAEIAREMQHSTPLPNEYDDDLDWANMNWTPAPVDADPDHERSSSNDISSRLLSLFELDSFTVEIRGIFGEYLLKDGRTGFEREERLLEIFKARLGEDKLQACEVMLQDMINSQAIDENIGQQLVEEQAMADSPTVIDAPLHGQIISSFFWPSLREGVFQPPQPVVKAQERYSKSFTKLKPMRRLHWLQALGSVVVELEFEDRVLTLNVSPIQAAVIYAFDQGDEEGNQPQKRTVQQLMDLLHADSTLVLNSLAFWIGRNVLTELDSATFAIHERLDGGSRTEGGTALLLPPRAEATLGAMKSTDDIMNENVALYSQFVVAMLTNQGPMPLPRILMMLKMVVPGGFPFDADETTIVLRGMTDEGSIITAGDFYRVA